VRGNDSVRDEEPEPQPPDASRGRRAREWKKCLFPELVRESGAMVTNRDDAVSIPLLDRDVHGRARGVLHHVRDQVRHHLIDAPAVPSTDGAALELELRDGLAPRELGGKALDHRLDEHRQIDLCRPQLESPGPQSRHVEQGTEEALEAFDLPERDGQPLRETIRCQGLAGETPALDLELKLHRGQGCLQLVRRDRQELLARRTASPSFALASTRWVVMRLNARASMPIRPRAPPRSLAP
jgi:hypothetical protein